MSAKTNLQLAAVLAVGLGVGVAITPEPTIPPRLADGENDLGMTPEEFAAAGQRLRCRQCAERAATAESADRDPLIFPVWSPPGDRRFRYGVIGSMYATPVLECPSCGASYPDPRRLIMCPECATATAQPSEEK